MCDEDSGCLVAVVLVAMVCAMKTVGVVKLWNWCIMLTIECSLALHDLVIYQLLRRWRKVLINDL